MSVACDLMRELSAGASEGGASRKLARGTLYGSSGCGHTSRAGHRKCSAIQEHSIIKCSA